MHIVSINVYTKLNNCYILKCMNLHAKLESPALVVQEIPKHQKKIGKINSTIDTSS